MERTAGLAVWPMAGWERSGVRRWRVFAIARRGALVRFGSAGAVGAALEPLEALEPVSEGAAASSSEPSDRAKAVQLATKRAVVPVFGACGCTGTGGMVARPIGRRGSLVQRAHCCVIFRTQEGAVFHR